MVIQSQSSFLFSSKVLLNDLLCVVKIFVMSILFFAFSFTMVFSSRQLQHFLVVLWRLSEEILPALVSLLRNCKYCNKCVPFSSHVFVRCKALFDINFR